MLLIYTRSPHSDKGVPHNQGMLSCAIVLSGTHAAFCEDEVVIVCEYEYVSVQSCIPSDTAC